MAENERQTAKNGGQAAPDGTPAGAGGKKRRRKRLWKHKDVNNGQKSFAAGLNLYKLIWLFIIGCVIGVLFETLYVYFTTGMWERRSGMLYGPFNQVYGLGAVLFTLVLYRFRKKNALLIFLASAVIGGAFEYVCSWVQQLAFGSVSWEYSDMPANVGGRTNLFYSLGWGLMGLIFITHTWPFISEMVERIPNIIHLKSRRSANMLVLTGKSLTIALAVLLAADLTLSG
ncbi:MAG: putative ABC transporter permease, partial [Oscillospiraceae bacterium]